MFFLPASISITFTDREWYIRFGLILETFEFPMIRRSRFWELFGGFGVLLLWVGSSVSGVFDVGCGGLGSWGSCETVDLDELLPDTEDQGASLERECIWVLRDSISSFLEDSSCRTERSSSSMRCFCDSISLRSSYVEEWHCISQFIRSSRSIISLDCWALFFFSFSSWLIISVSSRVSCSIELFFVSMTLPLLTDKLQEPSHMLFGKRRCSDQCRQKKNHRRSLNWRKLYLRSNILRKWYIGMPLGGISAECTKFGGTKTRNKATI